SSTKKPEHEAVIVHVRGTVQGVGFRPFIYNLAKHAGITGTVCNTPSGVRIEAIGPATVLRSFIKSIEEKAPPLAHLDSIETTPNPTWDPETPDFTILASTDTGASCAAIPPDIALCEDCYKEIFHPLNRRYTYPFTNCTNCGPRFTITETIPYDRPKTSMRHFAMCPACAKEYLDPADRRFHAQPNACEKCGPRMSYHGGDGKTIPHPRPLARVTADLNADRIIAIRGLGGFHLVANACSQEAVTKLRARKKREAKPFAIMVKDLTAASRFCHLNDQEKEILSGPEHPIILA
ncbi:unnamed protein product, partial [Cyprideis torosa]